MATITTRSGKGSPLTNNEVDANFTNLNTDKAELSGATFTGEIVAPSLDISGNIDVDGTTNLDVVDIDGAVDMASTLAVADTTTIVKTASGTQTALSIQNNTGGANNATAIDFHTASTKYATIRAGYGSSAPEMVFSVGNTPVDVFKLTDDGSLSTPTAGTSNVRFGVNAGNSIASGGNFNVVVGDEAGTAITIGDNNVAVGYQSLDANTTGSRLTAVGNAALSANTTAAFNVAVGDRALLTNTGSANNVAVGANALYTFNVASGNGYNVAVGKNAGFAVTTGVQNTLIGGLAGDALTTGHSSTALGYKALSASTTAVANTALGNSAGEDLTTGDRNVLVGNIAGANLTTADDATMIGYGAGGGAILTGHDNVGVGTNALNLNTSGASNTAVGRSALVANTTGVENCAVGANSLDACTTGGVNTAIGHEALTTLTTGTFNTALGRRAGSNLTTGDYNTFIGSGTIANVGNFGSGHLMTTGSKNTFLGPYNGNQNGLDLRTSSNNIVLADGDGNPRVIVDSAGRLSAGALGVADVGSLTVGHLLEYGSSGAGTGAVGVFNNTGTASCPALVVLNRDASTDTTNRFMQFYANVTNSGSTAMGGIVGNGASNVQFAALSDVREKENITSITGSLAKINTLNPVAFDWITSGEHCNAGFVAQEVETVFPEFIVANISNEGEEERKGVTGGMTGGIVPHLVKAIQELSTQLDAALARITTLEG